jgi:hypothetical protein
MELAWQGVRVLTRKRVLVVGVVSLAFAALVCGVVVWIQWSRSLADRVTVTWAGAPTCTGTTVNTNRPTPVIEAVQGMRCTLEVVVHNGSGRTVHLDNAYATFLGPHSAMVVRAAHTELLAGAANDGMDARYRLDRDLAPGEDHTFAVVVEFRPAGCNDSGTMTVYGWPTVDLTTLRRSHTVTADRNFRFHRDGATPGCSDM